MKITAAEFLKSCASLDQCPTEGLLELACVGRSNVGKSSLINTLLNRKGLAKVSRTPGKTRLLNYSGSRPPIPCYATSTWSICRAMAMRSRQNDARGVGYVD